MGYAPANREIDCRDKVNREPIKTAEKVVKELRDMAKSSFAIANAMKGLMKL